MTSASPRPQPGHADATRATIRRATRHTGHRSTSTTDLERFWPSRRGHAFDEFCR